MDFGDILKNWENDKQSDQKKKKVTKKKQIQEKKSIMESVIDTYSPDSDILQTKVEAKPYVQKVSREKMRRKKADLVLDLHGMSAEDAKMELNGFIRRSYKSGARKILIIHGKGNHTKGQAVLKPLVKSILELSPYIGDVGTPERRDGGSGATWAVVRQRSL